MQRRSAARPGFVVLGLLAVCTGVGACSASSGTASQTTTSVGSMPHTSLDGQPGPLPTGDLVEPARVAVIPDALEISADRRTMSVRTSYPTVGFCIKWADGLDVRVDGASIIVSAWMASNTPSDGMCTLDCGFVTQSVTLADPIPADASIVAVDDAVPGCAHDVPVITTTTIARP